MMQDAQVRVNMCARVIVPGVPHFAAGNGGGIPHLSPIPLFYGHPAVTDKNC